MRLSRALVLNLAGHGVPLLGALVAVPILTTALDPARFGFLALAWVITGYFGLFDFGTGRALTHFIAQRAPAHDCADLIGTGLALVTLLGVVSTLLALGLSAPILDALALPSALRIEALGALRTLALTLLVLVPLGALRGVLEGYRDFATLTALRIPLGLYSYLAPAACALWWSTDLRALLLTLLLGRALSLLLHARAVRRHCPHLRLERATLRPLIGFGGWSSVSSLIAPLLLQLDRVVVALRVSLAATGWYAVPADLIGRAAIVPAAVMGVYFPAFCRAMAEPRPALWRLFWQSGTVLLALLLPPMVLLALLAEPLLTLWLDATFAHHAAPVAQWLALGALISASAQPAFHLLQAAGQPRTTALIHLSEVLPFVLLLWTLTGALGIEGAAIAWVVRVSLSSLILNLLALRLLRARPNTSSSLP